MTGKPDTASPSTAATDTAAESVEAIERRLALVEVRLEQLFEHLNVTPRGGAEGGVAGAELDPNDDPEIQDLLAKGNGLQATKRYQELTGVSLEQARRAIDRAQADG